MLGKGVVQIITEVVHEETVWICLEVANACHGSKGCQQANFEGVALKMHPDKFHQRCRIFQGIWWYQWRQGGNRDYFRNT